MEKVRNAIIMAAGMGGRCVPLTYTTPKALLKVHGVPLVERSILQLREKGITEIIVIVNYKKEMFEYLVDKYGVVLVRNPEASIKNTLSSLYFALDYLDSSYIVFGDNFHHKNLFNSHEPESWMSCCYMKEASEEEWFVQLSPENRFMSISVGGEGGFYLLGPAYFSASFSKQFKPYIERYYNMEGTENYYWTDVLMRHLNVLTMHMRDQTGQVSDLDDIEVLRKIDSGYKGDAGNSILKTINDVIGDVNEAKNLLPIKVGMTNYSFYFEHGENAYVYRVSRDKSSQVLDRKKEHEICRLIQNDEISDELVWFNPVNGQKISRFLHGARHCDISDWQDVKRCIEMLKYVHRQNYKIEFVFDLFEQIDLFEQKWGECESIYEDHEITKSQVLSLKNIFDSFEKSFTLCHVDNAYLNFLFVKEDKSDFERLYLIDWEYAGMQEPHLDIVSFSMFANYNHEQLEALMEIYFDEVSELDRLKVFGYTSMLGFLWYLWYEHECFLGAPYRKHAEIRYKYAQDYYKIFMEHYTKSLINI